MVMNKAKKALLLLPLFFLFFICPALADAAKDLRLEGILYDGENLEESYVVLNGELLKKGETIKNYQVVRIERQYTVILDEDTGEEHRLNVTGEPAVANEEPEIAQADAEVAEETEAPKDIVAKAKAFWEKWNPQSLYRRMFELRAMLDTAKIYNSSVAYFNEHQVIPWEIGQVVRGGFLPASYEKGEKGSYRFYFDPKGEPLGIHADPVDPKTGLRFFFVGEDGIMRSELESPAILKSPPHDYW